MSNCDEEISTMEHGSCSKSSGLEGGGEFCNSNSVVKLAQRIIAEVIGTYFVIFAGCGSVVVNKIYGSVSFPGICITWGLIVTVMIYSVGHISGAHFNPTVTVTMALFRRFPIREVPMFIIAQFVGAILASGTLCLLFDVKRDDYFGTLPTGSPLRSLIIEIIATFLLMFVVSELRRTVERYIGELAGIAVGSTIVLDVFVAGPVSGASMNPTRSLAPAIVMKRYEHLWVYIVGPFIGAITGGFTYNLIRNTDKSVRELTKSGSFVKSTTRI